MKRSVTLLFFLSVVSISWTSKEKGKELFKGEYKLDSCRQEIPLTYKKNDDIIVAKKATELKGQELILLQFNKKTKEIHYKRYYLVSEKTDRDIFNYLVRKEDYLANKKVAIFLKFSTKYDRFYTAKCFDSILANNPDLRDILKEQQ
ncbi:MAG TPA: hypothetical protein DIW47_01470 [Bacteroidetes bacterium]|nr:hypothetical protein [Bacteroidota bacterium]